MIELKTNDNNNELAIIAFHGYGSNPYNMLELLKALNIKKADCFFPSGNISTIANDELSKGWFSIPFTSDLNKEIAQSRNIVIPKLKYILNHYEKIVLLGFSQGAMMCLDIMLNLPNPISGVVCLSGLNLSIDDKIKIDEKFLKTPIFVAHGINDEIIDINLSKKSFEFISKRGFVTNWNEYNMHHEVIYKEMEDIKDFIKKLLI
tara:strand:+ start:48 stop:662 length:615 start_codon:yes stop_codon:yes gene_type:complete